MLSSDAELTAAPPAVAAKTACRLCGAPLLRTLIDFGYLPLANRTVAADAPEGRPYPLRARICDDCALVQIEDVASPTLVAAPKASLSVLSAFCLKQESRFAETMQKRLRLASGSLVIEVGSKAGCLLRHFQPAGIPVLGIEPAADAASLAVSLGVPTKVAAFNTETAMEVAVRHGRADLLLANHVLPHAPDLFDFVAGLASMLRPSGIVCLQVPHLLSLLQNVCFDAFRHDVYTYLSLRVLERLLRSVALRVFDAERLPDHGGSLRVYACHADAPHGDRPGLKTVRIAESVALLDRPELYSGFSHRVATANAEIRGFLQTRKAAGRRIVAYGGSTRGATLLNCCGLTTAAITCVADADPAKQGRLMSGSRIPIVAPDALMAASPDDVVILSWPNVTEIGAQLQPLRQRGAQFWTLVPRISRV